MEQARVTDCAQEVGAVEGETVEHVVITSSKITGGGDRDRLETDLGSIPGVRDVNVDTDAHTVEVVFDPREVSVSNIKATLDQDGYSIDNESYGAARDTEEASNQPSAVSDQPPVTQEVESQEAARPLPRQGDS
jgi:copper chaperone CopZ